MADRTFDGRDVARKLRGKRTFTEIGKAAGVQRQTVAAFEEAPAKAQRETVRRLADAYGMTEQELREAVGIAAIVTPEVKISAPERAADADSVQKGLVNDELSPTDSGPSRDRLGNHAPVEFDVLKGVVTMFRDGWQQYAALALRTLSDEDAKAAFEFIEARRRGLQPQTGTQSKEP